VLLDNMYPPCATSIESLTKVVLCPAILLSFAPQLRACVRSLQWLIYVRAGQHF